MLNRSELLIISILGVLKAGCAYLPLPPDYPDERIKYIIEDSKTKLIITESSIDLNALSKYKNVKIFNLDSLEKKQFKSKRTFNIRPDDPAYLFYTSGSTGKPKGILNKHSAVTCFTENLKERFLIGDSDRIYAITTYAFDISILELICALLNSTSVTIAPDLANSDPKYFAEDILKNQITVLQITPSRLNALIDSIGIEFLKNIRTILIGGERFPDVLQLKLNKLHNTNIFNVYGPTETTIWSSAKKVSGKSINIGKPLINESMYILDDELKLIPIGAVGEICIGGTGLSLGYWENEELTKLRFINDPYNNNKIIFRTGDYGKFNFEGEIEFIGRKDEQIKIRGYRVELKEIEHAIESYSSIQSSIVIPIYQTSDDLFLVAFIISKIIPDINEIHKFLSKTLPYYMLPSDYFFIDSFPITANGKINKAELLDYYNSKAKKTNENPNFTELQERVREIWKSILNIENIQLNDKFIKLGGHSLKAIRLLSAFNKEFKTNITIKDFFIEPTILGMEKFLVPEINFEEIKIPVSVKKKFYNLTPSQKRLWVISQDDTASSAYNMPVAYKMRGKLNLDYLDKSINLLIQKFEILRTSFELIDDDPKQLIYDNITMNIEIINTSKEMVKELINKNIKYSFDLTSPPLFRVTLFRLDDEEYIFLFNIHHIISDAWSQELIFNEIIKNYNNLKSNSVTTLEIPEIQYKDYAEWKLNLKNGNKFKEDRNYWLKRFEEIPESLDLPNDKTRKLIKSFNGAIETLHISAKNFENINHFIQTNNLSPFSFYSGLIFLLLYKYTSQYDIVLGTVFAGRDFHQTHDQIGIFSNTIPLRLKINKNDFVIDCFNKIKANIFEDFLHQEFDYNELLKN
jgi:amino acid adenylation domain-containing protein